MLKRTLLLALLSTSFVACSEPVDSSKSVDTTTLEKEMPNASSSKMTLAQANKLIALPLECTEKQYPNKLNQTLGDETDLKSPKELHPLFYGCFDWHSAAHGYWSMVTLVSQFAELDEAQTVNDILRRNITPDNVAVELAYFSKKHNSAFERTYGWAWLLKLTHALHEWDDPLARQLENTLAPLSQHIVKQYLAFLPKLVYPIRIGEHSNTAFGLTFAYDYATATGQSDLQQLITSRAKDFYLKDKQCPITWEPSGFDFLSPCLEEIDIMRRVLPSKEFLSWLDRFMPELKDPSYQLATGIVGDRSDGKLVHLDGLNFSRAWVLKALANQFPDYAHLNAIAEQHIAYSYPNLVGDSYEGGHWLGSFAINALSH